MSEKLSFRPKGDVASRLAALVNASHGTVTATDIHQAAMEEYIAKLEREGVQAVLLRRARSVAQRSEEEIQKLFKEGDAQRGGKRARRKAS